MKTLAGAVLIVGLVAASGVVTVHTGGGLRAQTVSPPDNEGGWYCPMHPDVTSPGTGTCSKCGMALIHGNPFDTREYLLEMKTVPQAVRAGVPFRMQFVVSHPGTHRLVDSFEVVHDRRYHLFVISQDMSSFQHLHPELQGDGSWALEVVLPKPGYYSIISDFVPTGGSPQFMTRPLVTTGFEGDIASQAAHLAADSVMTSMADGIRADVVLGPMPLVSGEYGHLTFTLTDATTGEPVTDLQPYLGAFGHMLMLQEDMRDAVHSHPSPGPQSDVTRGRGGPEVTFEGYLPRPGVYRAWTQFLRHDTLSTFTTTIRVLSPDDAYRTR